MFEVDLNHYLILSAILFSTGIFCVLVRKNAIVILMGIELMLNGVNITFVAYSHFLNHLDGRIIVFFVMTIAAAEAGVGLALAVAILRRYKEINIKKFEALKG